jgi:hypothetical protein
LNQDQENAPARNMTSTACRESPNSSGNLSKGSTDLNRSRLLPSLTFSRLRATTDSLKLETALRGVPTACIFPWTAQKSPLFGFSIPSLTLLDHV